MNLTYINVLIIIFCICIIASALTGLYNTVFDGKPSGSSFFVVILSIICIGSLLYIKNDLSNAPVAQNIKMVTVNSKDTIIGKFEKKDNYYLNLKDSSLVYIDKIVYLKSIK